MYLIFGLVIIVLSVVYPLSKSEEINTEHSRLITKMYVWNIKGKTFIGEPEDYLKKENHLVEDWKTLNKNMGFPIREKETIIKDHEAEK